MDYFLQDLSRGLNRIEKGQIPDGSGTPIGDVILSDIYLVLLGRPNNQVAHGGKKPSGTLTLSSTTDPTKGLIYLGEAGTSCYDEAQDRIGVGTTAATAKVHIKVGGVANQLLHPSAFNGAANGFMTDQSSVTAASALVAALNKLAVNDATYIRGPRNLNGVFSMFLGSATNPGVKTNHKLSLRLAVTSAPNGQDRLTTSLYCGPASAATAIFTNYGFPSDGTVVTANVTSPAASGMGTTLTTYAYTLTTAEAALITDYSQLRVDAIYYTGFDAGKDWWCSFIEMQVPPAGGVLGDVLQKWENPTINNTLAYAQDSALATTLQMSGTPKLRITNGLELAVGTASAGNLWSATDTDGTGAWLAASALTATFQDNLFTIVDNVTPSKAFQFQASAISASTTRTYTMQDLSGTIALLEAFNIFTQGQTWPDTSLFTRATNRTLLLDMSVASDSTQTKIRSNSTVNRTIDLPDASTTLAGLSVQETFSALQIFTSAVRFNIGTPAAGKLWSSLDASGTGQWITPAGLADHTHSAGGDGGAVINGPTVTAASVRVSAAGQLELGDPNIQSGLIKYYSAATGVTINVAAPVGGSVATRVETLPAYDCILLGAGAGTTAVALGNIAKVNVTGVTANLGAANLTSAVGAGVYMMNLYMLCTSAASAGTLAFNATWADETGSKTKNLANLALTAVSGIAQSTFPMYITGGNISWSTSGYVASAKYALHLRCTYMGV